MAGLLLSGPDLNTQVFGLDNPQVIPSVFLSSQHRPIDTAGNHVGKLDQVVAGRVLVLDLLDQGSVSVNLLAKVAGKLVAKGFSARGVDDNGGFSKVRLGVLKDQARAVVVKDRWRRERGAPKLELVDDDSKKEPAVG